MLRHWLNRHPLGAPYRWLRDLLRLSANRRQLLDTQQRLLARIEQLEEVQRSEHLALSARVEMQARVLDRHSHALEGLAPLHCAPELPFCQQRPAPDWIGNAERVLGLSLERLGREQREHAFYGFYSEMAGGVAHVLQQQYRAYLPYLPRMPGKCLLDVGCGAGEFLSFLAVEGIPARGLDLDAGEVERARARGLDAVHGDALGYLSSCGETFAAISLLQVIEHVPPPQVRPLLDACIAALAPGGVLLVETVNLRHPNALNGFYTDPTHRKPLSDNYLSFLFQWYGLERVELLYTLPEWLPGISSEDTPRCYANYTVVGYRRG